MGCLEQSPNNQKALYQGQYWRAWTWRVRPVRRQLRSRARPIQGNIKQPPKRKEGRHLVRLKVLLADVGIVVRRLVHPHQEVEVRQLPHLWHWTHLQEQGNKISKPAALVLLYCKQHLSLRWDSLCLSQTIALLQKIDSWNWISQTREAP